MNKWEAKERFVEKKMAENAKVETLTDDQHEVLAWLCSVRHEMHTNPEHFFYSEWTKFGYFWDLISNEEGFSEINTRLLSVGLDPIDFSFVSPDDASFDFLCDSEEEYEDGLAQTYEMVDKINKTIEDYLVGIDKKHGTSYCPSGLARLR